jgi:two-component system sensor histidine kinase KdpD
VYVVQERVPDHLLGMADEILNIDLPADELITRLKEGKDLQGRSRLKLH